MQIRFTLAHRRHPVRRTGAEATPDASLERAAFRSIEAAGFDQVLLDGAGDGLEARTLAAAALESTERLVVALPHCPGDVSPVIFARQFADLAARGDGRLSLFMEAGQRQAGSLNHEAALARVDEYLTLLDQLWLNDWPIDHEGRYYCLRRAFIGAAGPRPQVRLGGVSGTALKVAGRHADMFHLPPGTSDETLQRIGRVREAASARGRSGKIGFAMPVSASGLVDAGDSRTATPRHIGFPSEIQRLAGILTSYGDLGIGEVVITGLRGQASIEAFGTRLLRPLRNALEQEQRPASERIAAATLASRQEAVSKHAPAE